MFFDGPGDHIYRSPVVPSLVFEIRWKIEHQDGTNKWICKPYTEEYNYCICGKCIKNNYIAVHNSTNCAVIVGSDCIKKFWLKAQSGPSGTTGPAAMTFENQCNRCEMLFNAQKMTTSTCNNCLVRKRSIPCTQCNKQIKWTGRMDDAPKCSCRPCGICGIYGVFSDDKCQSCEKLCNCLAIPHLHKMVPSALESDATVIDVVDILTNAKHPDNNFLIRTLRRWNSSNVARGEHTYKPFWDALFALCEKLNIRVLA